MTGRRGHSRWHEPMTWVQVIAVAAVIVSVAVVLVRLVGSPSGSSSPEPTATTTGDALVPTAGLPAPPTAPAGPQTCLQFGTGVRQCTPGLTWNAHLCWARSWAATLQMKTPSGAWTNVAVADVVTPSDYCSGDFPVETSIEYTETDDGRYTYRFLNHASEQSPGSPGDPFTVDVTTK